MQIFTFVLLPFNTESSNNNNNTVTQVFRHFVLHYKDMAYHLMTVTQVFRYFVLHYKDMAYHLMTHKCAVLENLHGMSVMRDERGFFSY